MNELITDNLSETRNVLIEEIASLNSEQFNSKPDIEKWSVAQVCHHLFLVEGATIKMVAWGLENCGHTQLERKNIQPLLLDRSRKFRAPDIVEPSANPFEVQEIIDLLNHSRTNLVNFLGNIDDKSLLEEKTAKHPALGELLLSQWIEQIYLHEQRHIEQIQEIKAYLELG